MGERIVMQCDLCKIRDAHALFFPYCSPECRDIAKG